MSAGQLNRYSFTQPICVDCWNERNPSRQAVATALSEDERCCHCNGETASGIYVRVDPATVPFPSITKG